MIIIIPARLESTRIDKKLLRQVNGKAVLGWTIDAALKTAEIETPGLSIDRIAVCTDSDEIEYYVSENYSPTTINVCNTTKAFPHLERGFLNGTERCWAYAYYNKLHPSVPIINVQGDSIGITPEVILEMAKLLKNGPGYARANTMYALREPMEGRDLLNESVVKVITNRANNAMFFTRAPYHGADKHCGIYGYYVAFLNRYYDMVINLEYVESLEQMRTLENEGVVHCPRLPKNLSAGKSINVMEDLYE